MPMDIIIATDKPTYLTSGFITASSSTYDTAVPTTTLPATASQTFVLPTNLGDKPSLLRVVPYHTSTAATSTAVRVIGWTTFTQTTGVALYVPTLLCDLTCAFNATGGSIPSFANFNGTANTANFFHSITVGAGVPTVNVYTPGTAASVGTPPAHAIVDTVGFQYVAFQFRSSTGSMGAFYNYI